jgi:hypothetical protein
MFFFREYANAYLIFIEGRRNLQEAVRCQSNLQAETPKEKHTLLTHYQTLPLLDLLYAAHVDAKALQ